MHTVGPGIIPVLIAGKSEAEKIVGVEIQEEVWEMANRTVKLNDLQERVEIVKGDIKTIDKQLEVHGYHVVTSNPPYMHMNGIQNPFLSCITFNPFNCKSSILSVSFNFTSMYFSFTIIVGELKNPPIL